MKQRVMTGIIAGAGFLSLLFLGGSWFTGLIFLLALIGFHEFVTIHKLKPWDISSLLGFIGILYFVFPWNDQQWLAVPSFQASLWIFMFLLLFFTVATKNKIDIRSVSLVVIGVVYIGMGFHYMIVTREMEHGLFWTLLIFACIWVTDSGAYFTGWAIGRRLLWPSISPKKTIEGAIGGIAFSVAAAIGFYLYAPDVLAIDEAVMIGILVAIVGQIGDLVESAFKRAQGVKDSGSILPGHGGILDRCDSWLIVFPFIHLLSILT